MGLNTQTRLWLALVAEALLLVALLSVVVFTVQLVLYGALWSGCIALAKLCATAFSFLAGSWAVAELVAAMTRRAADPRARGNGKGRAGVMT